MMSAYMLKRFTLLIVIWTYSTQAAPVEDMKEMEVATEISKECLREALAEEKLQAEFDACVIESETPEEVHTNNMVLLCILKKNDMVEMGEDPSLTWKEPMPMDDSDTTTNQLDLAIRVCKDVEKEIPPAMKCLVENLQLNCTRGPMDEMEKMEDPVPDSPDA